jgi:hypothetical protein
LDHRSENLNNIEGTIAYQNRLEPAIILLSLISGVGSLLLESCTLMHHQQAQEIENKTDLEALSELYSSNVTIKKQNLTYLCSGRGILNQ